MNIWNESSRCSVIVVQIIQYNYFLYVTANPLPKGMHASVSQMRDSQGLMDMTAKNLQNLQTPVQASQESCSSETIRLLDLWLLLDFGSPSPKLSRKWL